MLITKRQEFHKYFCVFLLISFLFFAVPAHGSAIPNKMFLEPNHKLAVRNDQAPKQYAVIFDAGSSGSRVHVYCFDQCLNLLPIVGDDLELFVQTNPGLSAYANDPKAAANSLLFLLEEAENVIPKELCPVTPVKVGATAGLRQLKGDASDKILQAVRDLLKNKSTLKYNADWVTILEGTEEASYQWVTVNYLLGNLGENYSNMVGVVDLGGGSVQMAYAISEEAVAKAPKTSDGNDTYVKEMYLKGKNYYLYAHSYLNYGLLAARAEILKATGSSDNPCILAGYSGSYKYGGVVYEASASPSGPSMHKCREVVLEALKVNATCTYTECTFNGIWNGGGGDGQKNLYVASFFFDKASQTGLINPSLPTAKVRPLDFGKAAERACKTGIYDAGSIYPRVEMNDIPYICMDLVYQITLLVDGFGLDPGQEITLVKQVEYQNHLVEAAWPLGSAIDAVSSLTQAQRTY